MYLKKAGPIEYIPGAPHGHPVSSDPYFTLMAGNDGVGFIHCGDGILVVPLDDDDNVLMAVERSAAFVPAENPHSAGRSSPDGTR